jgi:hypothetical protein
LAVSPITTSVSQEITYMTNRGVDIKNRKQRGEWAEMCFMAQAAAHGLCVAKPYGDSASYDLAIEYQGRFLRVQVKSTKYMRFGCYICHTASNQPYRANQIDFIAAYVIPLGVWYILPAAALQGKHMICLSPHRKNSKYGRYREAWHLLRDKPSKSRAAKAGR